MNQKEKGLIRTKINDIGNRKLYKKSIELKIGCMEKVIRKKPYMANKINYKLLI